MVFISGILRNMYIATGYYMSIRVRKVFTSAMYDKIATLSMRSMTETNSSKLVTMVSADIAALERALAFAPLCIYAPIVAGFAIYLVGVVSTWQDAAIVGVLWILTICASMYTSA